MKVLVTGGAGFIGSSVVIKLLERGDDVVILDNFNDFYDPAIKRANLANIGAARVVEGDIRDQECLHELLGGGEFDAVLHLAAMAGVRRSITDPLLYSDVNVRGTQLILRELENCETRLVFASSSSVYGAIEKVPFSEVEDIHQPVSPYAATKRAGELLCFTHHHLFQTPITCLRFFTVYGPRQRPEMAIHKFVDLCLKGKPIPFFGDGTTRRDYTYIDDIVDGVLRALDQPKGYRIYNLGESETISLAELVEAIGEVTGKQPILDRQPMQAGDVLVTYADISRAREELGYAPCTHLRQGLERFLTWYQSQRTSDVQAD